MLLTDTELWRIMLCLQQQTPLVHGTPQLSAQLHSVPHSLQVLVAPTLRDESGRRNAYVNAAALSRGTRGKGTILSSGARQAFELRGPYDVANLGTLFGLTEASAKASLFQALASLRQINSLFAAGGCEPEVRGCDGPCQAKEGVSWSCDCLRCSMPL